MSRNFKRHNCLFTLNSRFSFMTFSRFKRVSASVTRYVLAVMPNVHKILFNLNRRYLQITDTRKGVGNNLIWMHSDDFRLSRRLVLESERDSELHSCYLYPPIRLPWFADGVQFLFLQFTTPFFTEFNTCTSSIIACWLSHDCLR